jgi:GTP-binding protein LepA
MTPKMREIGELSAGEVGFFFSNIKTVSDVRIGDTVTEAMRPAAEPLPGFQEVKPMVFAGSTRSKAISMKHSGMRSTNCV